MEFQRIAAAARDVVELAAGQHVEQERLDGGVAGDFGVSGPFAVPFQFHVVHGGQLFASGPVNDSLRSRPASSSGAARARSIVHRSRSTVWSRVSSRIEACRLEAGMAGRSSAGCRPDRGWRGHILFWQGDDFIKAEGDPNYQARPARRIACPWGSRLCGDGPHPDVSPRARSPARASARVHRVEKDYELRIGIVAVAGAGWRLR